MTDLISQLGLVVPQGYGFLRVGLKVFPDDLYDRLIVWELPRKDSRYVVSVDVGDGIGRDRSVVDVTRMGTIKEPDEQVAQFVSAYVDPVGLAPIVDAVGRLYAGADGTEALCAIEINNHGLVTQSELQLHHGYSNLYQWRVWDAFDPEDARRKSAGWVTNQRTRPMMLALYLRKLKSIDPVTGMPDYRINSPLTMEELRSFQTLAGIREAEADPTNPNAHDDCIMAGAIGVQVSNIEQLESDEPLDQTRRRMNEEKARRVAQDVQQEESRDYINQDFTVEESRSSGYNQAVEDYLDDGFRRY